MTTLGWQVVLLAPLLLVIYLLVRALRRPSGWSARAPSAQFLVVSVLFHAGLLFALDLVLITLPVVESHKELIEAAFVKTFSIFSGGNGGSGPSWERVPDGPAPVDPAVEPAEARVVAAREIAFDPALSGVAPTIPEALASTLPPGRVLLVPRPAPAPADSSAVGLPRAVAVEPELPRFEAPPPPAVPGPPPSPVADPTATVERSAARDVNLTLRPVSDLPDLARVDPPLPPTAPPRGEFLPRLDAVPPPLPERRMADSARAVVLPVEPPELQASFALRPAEVRKDLVAVMGGTPASEAAVDRGLAWLAAHQAPAGNWSLEDLHCQGHRCEAAGTLASDPAATALALMAFLGAGHSPAGGTHAPAVKRGVDWLIAHQKPDGSLSDASAGQTQMYGQALATIALCESLGLTGDPALREPAAKAVKFIVEAQDPGTGGWRYQPRVGGDTSVFGWQLMALKSAEMAGLPVPAEAYQRATRWLDSVASGPRRELYAYQPGGEVRNAMTAEALLCRQYLGLDRSAESMIAGGAYLRTKLPDWGDRHLYYWYYATQVMFHLQGNDWAVWNVKIRDMLVESQARDGPAAGSWDPTKPTLDKRGDRAGRLYETAVSLLILEVYYRHLPLYQQLSGKGTADRD